jgi:hypothetical protein
MKRVLVVGLIVGCGSVDNKTPDAKLTDSASVDTTMIDGPPGPRCDPTKPFGSPQLLANVNSSVDDSHPFITADELQVWFSSNRPGSNGADIYMASRSSKTDDFGQAALIAGLNSAGSETRPTLTADGLTIYIQFLGMGASFYRITSSTRSSTTAAFPTPTAVSFSSTVHDAAQFVLPDHSAIYFNTNRTGSFLLHRSARVNGTFQTPAPVDGTDLAMTTNDYPVVTPDEKVLYFLSDRAGGTAKDNWKTTRPNTVQAFGNSTNVTELNVTEDYFIFSITADHCIAYVSGPNGANGNDLFVAKKPL